MFFTRKYLLASSILALGAVHCGGSSTPTSNTPEPPASEMAGDATSGQSTDPAAPNAAEASDAVPENSGAHSSMNLNDQQIAQVVANVHSAEIEQARLAQKKTTNEQVRQFAAMMIQQHTQAQQKESALNLGKEESPLSQQLSTRAQATLQALSSKQGDDFDRSYLEVQVAAHQQALDAIQNELRPNAQNPALQVYLQELQPTVAQHLEHARQAQQSLQSSNPSQRGSTARAN